MSKKIKIPVRILRLALALLSVLISFATFGIGVWQITTALWRFLSGLGEGSAFFNFLATACSPGFLIFGDGIPSELAERIEIAFGQMISTLISNLATAVTSWVAFLPKGLFFLLICVISVVYFAIDLEKINSWAVSLIPKKLMPTLSGLRTKLFCTCAKYLRSYLLLMLITFGVMLSGMLLLGVNDAVVLAIIVSVLDILPIIGVGTVLIPWSIFEFISGNNALGVGILVLFIVNTVIRQFAEPKILGKNLDMHPILTLIMLYAGYALFGIVGLLLVPIMSILLGVLINKNNTAEIL